MNGRNFMGSALQAAGISGYATPWQRHKGVTPDQDGRCWPGRSIFMAKIGDEQTPLELACQLETAQPWFDNRPEDFA